MLKQFFLVFSLIISVNIFFTIFTPEIAEAKKSAFTKKDVDAIKNGTFIHAKGKIGTTQNALAKKGVKKYKDDTFVYFSQMHSIDVQFFYEFTVYNPFIEGYETYDTVHIIDAFYDKKMDTAIFKKYFKRDKKRDVTHHNIIAYKVGSKRLFVSANSSGTHLTLFKNTTTLDRFKSIAE